MWVQNESNHKNKENYISFSVSVEVGKHINKNGEEKSGGNRSQIHR